MLGLEPKVTSYLPKGGGMAPPGPGDADIPRLFDKEVLPPPKAPHRSTFGQEARGQLYGTYGPASFMSRYGSPATYVHQGHTIEARLNAAHGHVEGAAAAYDSDDSSDSATQSSKPQDSQKPAVSVAVRVKKRMNTSIRRRRRRPKGVGDTFSHTQRTQVGGLISDGLVGPGSFEGAPSSFGPHVKTRRPRFGTTKRADGILGFMKSAGMLEADTPGPGAYSPATTFPTPKPVLPPTPTSTTAGGGGGSAPRHSVDAKEARLYSAKPPPAFLTPKPDTRKAKAWPGPGAYTPLNTGGFERALLPMGKSRSTPALAARQRPQSSPGGLRRTASNVTGSGYGGRAARTSPRADSWDNVGDTPLEMPPEMQEKLRAVKRYYAQQLRRSPSSATTSPSSPAHNGGAGETWGFRPDVSTMGESTGGGGNPASPGGHADSPKAKMVHAKLGVVSSFGNTARCGLVESMVATAQITNPHHVPGPGQYNTDHLYPAVPASHNRRPRQKLRGKLKAEAKASYKAAMQRRRAKRRAALHALVAGASSPKAAATTPKKSAQDGAPHTPTASPELAESSRVLADRRKALFRHRPPTAPSMILPDRLKPRPRSAAAASRRKQARAPSARRGSERRPR